VDEAQERPVNQARVQAGLSLLVALCADERAPQLLLGRGLGDSLKAAVQSIRSADDASHLRLQFLLGLAWNDAAAAGEGGAERATRGARQQLLDVAVRVLSAPVAPVVSLRALSIARLAAREPGLKEGVALAAFTHLGRLLQYLRETRQADSLKWVATDALVDIVSDTIDDPVLYQQHQEQGGGAAEAVI